MELSLLRCTLAAVLTAATAAAQVTITDELFPGAAAGERGPYLTRLVDDLSGAPIAGAEVFLVPEHGTPMCGEFWFEHRGTSDADGFVRIDVPTPVRKWHWQVMRHPTAGVAVRNSSVAAVWRIGRPFDVPLEIRDWAGRPVGGARIGLCGGCGHSPDVANATAGPNGFAVLRGIDPQQGIADLYVQHPGLHFFYESVRWRPGEPPMVVQCGFAPDVRGRVVAHDGTPVAGAFVCAGSKHRGPWARTAADGTFTVLGCEPGDTPHRVVLPDGRDLTFDVDGDDPYPVTLRLPEPYRRDAYEGTVEVTANARPVPPAVRRVRVVVEQAPPDGVEFFAWYPQLADKGDVAKETDAVDVPIGVPFVLVVRDDHTEYAPDREYAFQFADAAAVPDPLTVRWQPDPRVTGRVVDAAGRPVPAVVDWGDERGLRADAADGTFDLTAGYRRGWQLMGVRPNDGALRPRYLWVLLPADGGTRALGDLAVGQPPQLTVRDGSGAPLAGATVALLRPGWQEPADPSRWPLDAEGGWLGPDLQQGDWVVVRRDDDAVPFRTELKGSGPWTIVPPDGAVDLDVVGADGARLGAVVVVGDHAEESDGPLRLHGLPHGPTRLWISAPGHRSARVDVEVGAAPRTVRVELPPRR